MRCGCGVAYFEQESARLAEKGSELAEDQMMQREEMRDTMPMK
jgi:hypothetical protein